MGISPNKRFVRHPYNVKRRGHISSCSESSSMSLLNCDKARKTWRKKSRESTRGLRLFQHRICPFCFCSYHIHRIYLVRPGLEMLLFPVDPDRSLAVLSHEQVALRAYFIGARRRNLGIPGCSVIRFLQLDLRRIGSCIFLFSSNIRSVNA